MPNTSNLAEFNREVQQYASTQVPRLASIFTRKIAFLIHRSVIQNTRVDTGRAKGAWIVSLDSPTDSIDGIIDAKAVRKLAPSEVAAVTRAAIDKGSAVIERHTPYGVIWIVNNVDYILFLEEGTDKTPPDAMAARALQEVRAQFGA